MKKEGRKDQWTAVLAIVCIVLIVAIVMYVTRQGPAPSLSPEVTGRPIETPTLPPVQYQQPIISPLPFPGTAEVLDATAPTCNPLVGGVTTANNRIDFSVSDASGVEKVELYRSGTYAGSYALWTEEALGGVRTCTSQPCTGSFYKGPYPKSAGYLLPGYYRVKTYDKKGNSGWCPNTVQFYMSGSTYALTYSTP